MSISRKNKSPQQLSAERHEVLLVVAESEFLERGFRGCSIDHIARLSRVSKTTIYRQYPNKEALFEAVAMKTAEGFGDLGEAAFDTGHPEARLRALAERIYRKLREKRYRELFRLLIAEAPHLPDLVQRVRLQMMERLLAGLTTYFVDLIAAGKMHHPDPTHAATTFYVLAAGSFRLLLNSRIDEYEEQNKLEADISLFLRGVGMNANFNDEETGSPP